MDEKFDLIILGAGSGGLAAAKRAASYGAKVAIIEGDKVGGTCVIRGCVPKKLLVYGSLYSDYIRNASSFGYNISSVSFSSQTLLSNVRKEVDRLNLLHIHLLKKLGVCLIEGWGSFISHNKILVRNNLTSESKVILGDKIIIATGGIPNQLDISGAEKCWVSDDVFLQKELPNKIFVIGAGYIACEFSCIFKALGIEVVQLVRGKSLLKGFDSEITQALTKQMTDNGINLKFSQYPISIDGEKGKLSVKTNKEEFSRLGAVLIAIGRTPFLKGLDLDLCGVELTSNKISVDLDQKTNIDNIYALGDVTNKINLTPVAIDEGRSLADKLFGNKKRNVNYQFVPKAVFSQPEIASVGLSEQEAIETHGSKNIKIYRAKFRPMSHALPKTGGACLLKLIVDITTDIVIGCHMVGEHSAEIIQMAAIPVSMRATKEDFDKTMALHPTISEEFVTMT